MGRITRMRGTQDTFLCTPLRGSFQLEFYFVKNGGWTNDEM